MAYRPKTQAEIDEEARLSCPLCQANRSNYQDQLYGDRVRQSEWQDPVRQTEQDLSQVQQIHTGNPNARDNNNQPQRGVVLNADEWRQPARKEEKVRR